MLDYDLLKVNRKFSKATISRKMIIGFEQICSISFQLNPGCIIKSMFVNIHTGQPHVFFLDSSVSLMKCCKNIQKLSTLSGALICGVCTIDYSTN